MEKKTVKKAYLEVQARADTAALNIMHFLNCTEAFRNRGEDTWSDVATLASIAGKLEEILTEVKGYYNIRVEEPEE